MVNDYTAVVNVDNSDDDIVNYFLPCCHYLFGCLNHSTARSVVLINQVIMIVICKVMNYSTVDLPPFQNSHSIYSVMLGQQ